MRKKRFLVERCKFSEMSVVPVESADFDDPEAAVKKYLEFCRCDPSMACIEAKEKKDADALLGYVYLNWNTKFRAEIGKFYNVDWFYKQMSERLNDGSPSPFLETGCYEMVEPFSVG